jgi:hypothetical protein
VILGQGRRLFGDDGNGLDLKRVGAQALDSGTMILTYQRAEA